MDQVRHSTISVKGDRRSNIFPYPPSARDCPRAASVLALDPTRKRLRKAVGGTMIPIVVDPRQSALALIGRGPAAERRLEKEVSSVKAKWKFRDGKVERRKS